MPELENDTQTPEIPEDFSAYEAYRNNGGETPKDEDTSEANGPEEAEPEAESASESETDEEAEQEEEKPEEEQPKKKGGFQRRIDRLTREKAELADRLTRLEQGLAQSAVKPGDENREAPKQPAAADAKEPDPKDFETWEKYTAALVEFRLDAREKAKQADEQKKTAAERQKAVVAKWTEQVEQGRDDYDDFDDVVVKSKRPVSQAVQAFILKSDVGRHVAYELGKDPGALDRINKLDAIDATRELLQIEAQHKKPAPEQKPKVTKAPKPVKPVSGAVKPAPRLDDPNIGFDQYEQLRKKQLAAKRR
jgi:hypothetical protein